MSNSSCSKSAGYHCVPYYQCDTCSTIIVDGSSLFDPRSACGTSKETLRKLAVTKNVTLGEKHRQAILSRCSKEIEVCCRHPNSPLDCALDSDCPTNLFCVGEKCRKGCSEFADAGYHCVPYYQCDACSTIIVDGSSLFDPRSDCGASKEILQ